MNRFNVTMALVVTVINTPIITMTIMYGTAR
jgi:hypothetical protein